MDPVYGYQSVNVEAQRRYDTSLLNWVRAMIHLRKRHLVFGRGSMEFIKPANRKILVFTRADAEETVLCVFNLSQFAQPVELNLSDYRGLTPVEMMGWTEFPEIGERQYQLSLGPRAFYWFLLRESTK